MKNLQVENSVDSHFKPIKDSDGVSTAMELSTNGARVKEMEIEKISGKLAHDSNLVLDAGGDIKLEASGGDVTSDAPVSITSTLVQFYTKYDATNLFRIATGSTGTTTLRTIGAGTTDSDMILDADGDIVLDSANGVFIAKNNGTEFSVANSSYAGMILGTTVDGINQTPGSYTLTASEALVASSTHHISFVAPPSEAVEIEVQINYDAGSGSAVLSLGLSDNATIGSNGLASYILQKVHEPARGINAQNIIHKWIFTGLTAGTSYKYYLTAFTHTTSGTPVLRWGGDSTGEIPLFIMKAIALPLAVSDYAIYS